MKPGDVKFLRTARGVIYCTVVKIDDDLTAWVTYEGLHEPVRVARSRLLD